MDFFRNQSISWSDSRLNQIEQNFLTKYLEKERMKVNEIKNIKEKRKKNETKR